MSAHVAAGADRADGRDTAARMADSLRAGVRGTGRFRIIEIVAGFILFTGLPVNLPFKSEAVTLGLLLVISLGRKPLRDLGKLQLLVPILVIAVSYLALVSFTATPTELAADWRGRLLRMVVVLGFAIVVASGRLDLRSILAGFAAASLVNIPLFYAGLVSRNYGDYLTGWAGDKNYSGLVYCITGILLLAYAKSPYLRFLVVVVYSSALWLTGSRTSLAAFAGAMIWILIAPRVNLVGRWLLAGVIYWGVMITAEDYSQIGQFSDREGSDLLRARIDEAAQIKTDGAGFFGMGLGEAVVEMDGGRWFFHNSYLSALVEGGWPWLLAIVLITVVVMLQPFKAQVSRAELYAQALAVGILICAWRLGEVFVTVPWALALAFALIAQVEASKPPAEEAADGEPLPGERALVSDDR